MLLVTALGSVNINTGKSTVMHAVLHIAVLVGLSDETTISFLQWDLIAFSGRLKSNAHRQSRYLSLSPHTRTTTRMYVM